MARNCILKCLEDPGLRIFLPDMQSKCVGRSAETKIVSKRCSRKQVEFYANYKNYSLKATQIGPNPSSISGVLLPYKKSALLIHGDSIELVAGDLKYTVHFEPSQVKDSWQKIFKPDPKLTGKRSIADESPSSRKAAKADPEMSWEELFNGDILVLNRLQHHSRKKVAAYDMDGTLITTKSGLVFPKTPDDWRIIFPQVSNKLRELMKDGYKLVLFTNQAGIRTGKQTVSGIQNKICDVIKKLGITAQVLVSTGIGKYRKPMTGMWDYFCKECNGNMPISTDECLYVGDAAGRLEVPKQRKKDHSCADRLFALNVGIQFYTPEEHFLGKKPLSYQMPLFDPRALPQVSLLMPENSQLSTSNGPEVILFVGYPGCGKSHFYQTHLQHRGYAHANRDGLGSWQKCVSMLEKSLKDGKSVVVDNTNPDVESRKRYIDVAARLKVPVRCFLFNAGLEQAMHNNKFREITGSSHTKVNIMVYNSFKSKHVKPTLEEGYSEIVRVNFVSNFKSDQDKKMYCQFLLEK